MGAEYVLIGLILVCGFYVAWNIGANDVANAMGTSVGSGALTLRRAVILAAIFEFAGAYIVGSNVAKTVRKGIFDPLEISNMYPPNEAPFILACGMIAALLAAGTRLLIATYMSWPVSTTCFENATSRCTSARSVTSTSAMGFASAAALTNFL